MLGNHAILFNSSSKAHASHDTNRFMVCRKTGVKGEEKRQTFMTSKLSSSSCYDMVS